MRNDVKIKILLQGLLPKIKAELYLRMPADFNDFEELCKQLFISEHILQNKESNEDRELTALVAGITHHEKQQDKELTQQKNFSSLATYRTCFDCYKKGHIAKECWTVVTGANHSD